MSANESPRNDPLMHRHPTPLDALLASHIYPIYSTESSLSAHLATMPEIGDYVDRVLTVAGARVK
jgi:hypothetical protein